MVWGDFGPPFVDMNNDMYVCLCADKVESEIQAAIEDGATTMEALMETLDVGTGCGCCQVLIKDMLKKQLNTSS